MTPDIEVYKPQAALSVVELADVLHTVEMAQQRAMRKGVDYGVIPGTGSKPTLLKPGAESLAMLFGLGHDVSIEHVDYDSDDRPHRVTIKCTVTRGDLQVAADIGSADYDEAKFFQPARPATENKQAKSEFRAPWNTLVKMASKRAFVGAVLKATRASGLFTQDVEDSTDSPGPHELVKEVAREKIAALPQEVRDELTRRRRPEADWTVDDWAGALLEAGRISAEAEIGSPPGPADLPPDVPDERFPPDTMPADRVSDAQRRRIFVVCKALHLDPHGFSEEILGHPVGSLNELSKSEAKEINDALTARERMAAK